jgi:hypothetical protein
LNILKIDLIIIQINEYYNNMNDWALDTIEWKNTKFQNLKMAQKNRVFFKLSIIFIYSAL